MYKKLYFKTITILITLCLTSFIGFAWNNEFNINKSSIDDTSTSIQDYNIRGGLPHLKNKIQKGKEINIAYLGGSITQAKGWRVYSLDWFAEQYPNIVFNEIQAAIGGTNSQFGVFRLEEHVLRHNPDLVFIEFAVNDKGLKNNEIEKSIEGIIRKIQKANIQTDICLIYTLNKPMLPALESGEYPRTVGVMEKVAEHYNLSSINFAPHVIELLEAGNLIFQKERTGGKDDEKIFSSDGTHPFPETGHKIYMETFKQAMESILKADKKVIKKRPKPLRLDNYENARMIFLSEKMLSGNWKNVTSSFSEMYKKENLKSSMPKVYKAMDSTSLLELKIKGSFLGFFDLIGPGAGIIEVSIDNAKAREFCRFDGYCTYYRFSSLSVDEKLAKKNHIVKVWLKPKEFDKEKILRLDMKYKYHESPEMFREFQWYPVAIMVLD